jgi:inner membrane protein
MSRSIPVKVGLVFLLALLLFIPLTMIRNLIGERQALRDGVVQDIARDSIDAQHVIGPVVVVPWKRRTIETSTIEDREGKQTTKRWERVTEGRLAFLPERLEMSGELTPEERNRGIYKATLYETALAVSGRIIVPADFGITEAKQEYEFGSADLVFGVSDPRGIASGISLQWPGGPIEFQPGAEAPGFPGGITAHLGALDRVGAAFDFGFTVRLKGLERIDFVPTGKDSDVTLSSRWPDPSFYGRFLPTREVTADGFSASWRTSFLSTNVKQTIERCIAGANAVCSNIGGLAHGVALFRPVDVYQQLERSAKYGFLFIGLTFIAFFLLEVLRRLAIHPVQYGLVGIALAMFYLLLTPLSEEIAFALAYAISAASCIVLIGFYVAHVLASASRGALFGAGLGALYGMLYVLISAEEHALLMGSIVLFAMLALVMIGTRKIDWYAIEAAALPKRAPPKAETEGAS